ncbi:MAG: ferrous iron transport protein B [Ekhidna sp.]|nr:ferrous iron transport protein B [Ekhidna sp.]
MRKIALVGNPNVGKSTLFNKLTGLNQHVGNYPGVTVDKKYGITSINGEKYEIVDLPGVYSINPKSEDERIVYEYLTKKSDIDLVVVIADALNLERNLVLFSQIYDLNLPIMLVVNRIDMKGASKIDPYDLSRLLGGIPVAAINARTGDLKDLKDQIGGFERPDQWQQFYTKTEEDNYEKEIEERFAIVRKLLKFLKKESKEASSITNKLDQILVHRFFGYGIFIGILFLIFQFLYAFANVPMDLIDSFFGVASGFVSDFLPAGPVSALLAEGIIPGIGGVVIFIPQIALLFLFLTILEETGYMTRAVFLMDKLMRPFGLHGKSVVPLMSGVACAIPGIMAARSIDQPKERLITILVTPLMSCSARLPVYILLITLTVPDQQIAGFINLQGLVLLGMYLLGLIAALLFGMLFKFILKTESKSFLIMEMPQYQVPYLKNVLFNVYEKSKAFVWGAGRIIIALSIILWVLGSYGPDSFGNDKSEELISQTALESSFIGIAGQQIEPVIEPLGYDWKIGIALITSFAAREVFVSTMATIYSIDNEEDEASLLQRMNQEVDAYTGEKRYGLATGISLMIFYAFAMQCMSTLAITKRETKTWKWPLIQFGYMTTLAYVSSLIVYQLLA